MSKTSKIIQLVLLVAIVAAGINLYLTVFATSLALHQGWIVLSPAYHDLQILDHPAVLIVSGVLYFFQFFADKGMNAPEIALLCENQPLKSCPGPAVAA